MVNISAVHMSHIETGYTKLSLPVLVILPVHWASGRMI